MRRRPFAVEQHRRQVARTPADVWRQLVGAAKLQARRATGEVFGVSTDGGEAERWALMEFGKQVAHAPELPLDPHDNGAGHGRAIFIRAAAAFCAAGIEGRRRLFAPVLLAAAEAVEGLMDEAAPIAEGIGARVRKDIFE